MLPTRYSGHWGKYIFAISSVIFWSPCLILSLTLAAVLLLKGRHEGTRDEEKEEEGEEEESLPKTRWQSGPVK